MKKSILYLMIGLAGGAGLTLLMSHQSVSSDENPRSEVSSVVAPPKVPASVEFAGQTVDLCRSDLHERMDREREDFELEVGSAGLTSPLKTLRQFAKYEGEEVEVLMRDGRKLIGILGAADDEGFDLTWTTMEKVIDPLTGKQSKKKQEVQHEEHLKHTAVNQVKYIIKF